MSRILTLARLKKAGACSEQIDRFRRLFGEQVEVTEALCAELAHAFDWGWAAEHLLSPLAEEVYDAALDQAWEAYLAALAQARAAYTPATAQACETYGAARAQARDAYDAACARAWASAYIADQPREQAA